MKKLNKPLVAMLGLVALAAGGAGVAQAVGGDQERGEREGSEANDGPDGGSLRGGAFERAERAALKEAGGGQVLEAETGDKADAAYEVAVRRSDGSVIEYHLDRGFRVIGTEQD